MDHGRPVARLVVLAVASLAVACGGSSDSSSTPSSSCVAGSACTPASPAACETYGKICAADGTFTCGPIGAAADGTSCGIAEVCSSGSCVAACVAAETCTPGSADACKTYGKTCNATLTGFTCDPVGDADDGTSCGSGEVCGTGNCVAACVAGATCTPSGTPDACKTYGKRCNLTLTGFSCEPVGNAADGASCGSGQVCSSGSCVAACVAGSTCTPSGAPDACKTYGKTCNPTRTGFTCDAAGNAADGTTCGSGQVCNTGSCVAACVGGGACTPAGTPDACRTYGTVCNGTLTGSTCEATGNVTDGTSCGSGQVCSSGSCVAACVSGESCTPSGTPDPCKTYGKTCNGALTGFTCDATGNATDGASCGAGHVCGGGVCNACVAGAACTSSTPCNAATLVCTTGYPVCTDTGAALADGASCGGGNSCAAGICQAPCAHATVRVPGSGSPLWSAEFAAWLSANGYAHLAANQGWGGGTGCGGGASLHNPVVLLHGNTASADPSTSLNALAAKLSAGGYTPCDLFAISWIEQNSDTTVNHHKASYLKLVRDFVQAVQGYTGKSQVVVVGHSMGVTIGRKAIQGGIAYEDPGRTTGCDLGPSLSSGVDTFLGVAGVNRGLTMCAGSATNSCSENGFKIDGAYLRDVNGGSAGSYTPAPLATHVYSIYLPADGYICGANPRGRGPWACEVFGTHTSIIPSGEFARSYDPFNEDYGTSYGLNFNCTADAFGRANNCDHILVVNDSFSLDGMVRMIRDHQTTTLPAPAFSQADLVGDWEEIGLWTNEVAGWQASSVSIDGSGNATFTNTVNSDGTTSASSLTLDVDDNGVVTLVDPLTLTSLQGRLSADKNLLVATYGSVTPGSGSALLVLSRRTGAAFGQSDVEGLSFRMLALQSGGGTLWEDGSGTTDGTGAITFASLDSSAGPLSKPPAGFDTLQIDASGRTTLAIDGTFHGVMTPDKNAVFAVQTVVGGTPTYVLSVFLKTGQAFVEGDIGGSWEFHNLLSGGAASTSSWGYGRFGATSGGVSTYRYWASPYVVVSLPNIGTLTVGAGGALVSSANATFRGQVAGGKDWYVRVQTSGGSHLGFGVR